MSYIYVKDHIPKDTPLDRRPGGVMAATTLTIHNTGNVSSTAKNERAWLTNATNSRTASFHIVVDEVNAIECLPLTEHAWHSGDGSGDGNMKSIGIEICESGDYAQTLDNAAGLVASMLYERGWGVDRMRRHYDWSGKICPRLMYDSGKWTGWATFKAMVSVKIEGSEEMTAAEQAAFEALEKKVTDLEEKASMTMPTWAKDAVVAAKAAGIIDTADGGSYDFYRILTIMHRKGLI